MVAVAFGMGLLLAFTRHRPEPRRVPPRIATDIAAEGIA
jgi:hypothetical protein